jgi:D-alanyl-D-alanine carboxypeptidase/D-alanyl-D-alanine-endopeptidase (penicillin-binding protein 4)
MRRLDLRSGRWLAALLGLLTALSGCAGGGRPAARPGPPAAAPAPDSAALRIEEFRRAADSLLADSLLDQASCGVCILSLDSGREVYSRHPSALLVPASVNKLFVAVAALRSLGPAHRFRTAVYGAGPGPRGVMPGPLYLKGFGDPDLKASDLEALAFRLRALGLKRVEGGLVVDAFHFDTTSFGYGWMWDEGPYAYNAPISALSLEGNTFELGVRPGGARGAPVRAEFRRASSYLRLENRAVTARPGTKGRLRAGREPGPSWDLVKLSGTMALDGGVEYLARTVTRPALYCGTVFKELLAASGITVAGAVSQGPVPGEAPELAWHLSPPLYQLLRFMNKESDNFTAEMIYRLLEAGGRADSASLPGDELPERTAPGRLLQVLEELGFRPGDIRLADGSGLSRYNLCSPEQLVRVLQLAYADPFIRPELLATLPISGTDGTISRRMAGEQRGLVRAKTGTLTGVSSLAGFAFAPQGRAYCFAVMFNHYTARASGVRSVQDSLIARLLAIAP